MNTGLSGPFFISANASAHEQSKDPFHHLADFPNTIEPDTYRLLIKGAVSKVLSLSLDELKTMPGQTELVAINQCLGNSRGYFSPRVFGAQLGNGAMGNARWTGVSLKAVLERSGVQADARDVTFNGLYKPVMASTPDYHKALDIEHALSPEPLLAWAINGEDLPFLNGYPLKLIVPGYFGTYWVKHLAQIEVIDHPFTGHDAYFMSKGLPAGQRLPVRGTGHGRRQNPADFHPASAQLSHQRDGWGRVACGTGGGAQGPCLRSRGGADGGRCVD